MGLRCQQDLLFSSQKCRVFESDLPCLDSDLPSVLLIFRVIPSHIFQSVLPTFASQPFSFFDADLLSLLRHSFSFFESDLPIFWVSPPSFSSQIFSFFQAALPTFPSQSLSFFESDLLHIFFTVSFQLFPVLSSDLIAMYTVDKIKDVRRCFQEALTLHYK